MIRDCFFALHCVLERDWLTPCNKRSAPLADYIVFLVYFLIVSGYGFWVYSKKKAASASSKDHVLAEGALTGWAIGASLIASNISAELMIGMSGSGFKMGLAIAT